MPTACPPKIDVNRSCCARETFARLGYEATHTP
jgi:hypothetical protein